MRSILFRALVMAGLLGYTALGAPAKQDALRVFLIDVEGGQATLFITPAGTSLLIDTGWPEREGRDADRIVAVARKNGLRRIDYVLLTHYHDDHAGGVPNLVARIPVGTFIDHGPNRELDNAPTVHGYAEYGKVLATGKYKHIVAQAGDVLPIAGMTVRVISADGVVIDKPLAGAGQANGYCAQTPDRPADTTENGRSLGVEITFGALKILDLGDLTWDKEKALMCPANKLGQVDVLVVSHHGWNQSSSPALVNAIGAHVALLDNGATKGGSAETMKTLLAMPGDTPGDTRLWQLHYSDEAGSGGNANDLYIANPKGGPENDNAFGLELIGERTGNFVIVNERNGQSEGYGSFRETSTQKQR